MSESEKTSPIDHSEFVNVSLWVIRWILCIPLGAAAGIVTVLLLCACIRIYAEEGFWTNLWGDLTEAGAAGFISAWVCGWTAPHAKPAAVTVFTGLTLMLFSPSVLGGFHTGGWRGVIFAIVWCIGSAYVCAQGWVGNIKFVGSEMKTQ